MDKNFDKLLKDKINTTKHQYDPALWNSVAKNVGKSNTVVGLSSKIFFSTIALLILVGTATYIYFSFDNDSVVENNIIAEQSREIENTKTDNLVLAENSKSETKEDSNIAQNSETKSVFAQDNQAITSTDKFENNSSSNISKEENLVSAIQETVEYVTPSDEKISKERGNTTAQNIETEITDIEKVVNENKSNFENPEYVEQYNIIHEIDETAKLVSNEIDDETELNSKEIDTIERTELSVNSTLTKTRKIEPDVSRRHYQDEYKQMGGEAAKKGYYNFASIKNSIDNYLSISNIGLERSRDIAVMFNNHFISDASLSGYESRYTLMGLYRMVGLTKLGDGSLKLPSSYYISNSFPISSKNIGVGIAFSNKQGPSFNSFALNISSSYQQVINRNNAILYGVGLNVGSIDKLGGIENYFWEINTPSPIRNENYFASLNAGIRYIHKSLYFGLASQNLYTQAFNKDFHKSISPFILHFNLGGKLRISQQWAIHPSLNAQWNTFYGNRFYTPYLSFSRRNKFIFGVHSENLQSAGLHLGYETSKTLYFMLKTGLTINNQIRREYGIINYGEMGIKIELGNFQKMN
ncbi:MAG: type IX secretion system membrane protein PorP/SprF [Bacteroidales bacterium]